MYSGMILWRSTHSKTYRRRMLTARWIKGAGPTASARLLPLWERVMRSSLRRRCQSRLPFYTRRLHNSRLFSRRRRLSSILRRTSSKI